MPEAPTRRDTRAEEHVSPEEAFGAGIAVATQQDVERGRADFVWDLMADATGDIASVSGVAELQKDIAFRIARNGWAIRGGLLTPNAIAELELDARTIGEDDPRILTVEAVEVRADPRQVDAIEVSLEIVADSGQRHELVIPVEHGESTESTPAANTGEL